MWVVVKNENVQIFANDPDQNIFSALKEQFLDAQIFKSKKHCINEVNALIFQVKAIEGDDQEVKTAVVDDTGNQLIDENGEPVFIVQTVKGPSKTIELNNQPIVAEDNLIVLNEQQEQIGKFELIRVE